MVEIYAWEQDHRRKVVGSSPWLESALLLTDILEKDGTAPSLGTTSPLVRISKAIRILKTLAEDGLIEMANGREVLDPGVRKLTIGGQMRRGQE